MSLLDNASLVLTPNAYKEGKLYSVIPSDGSGDFTFTRATTATRVNSDGLVELVPYNLLQYSEVLNQAIWTVNSISIDANNTTAPDGTLTAEKIRVISGQPVGSSHIQQVVNKAAGILQFSCSSYLKAAELNSGRLFVRDSISAANNANVQFNLNTGVISLAATANGTFSSASATITNVGNGWYRCTLSFTSSSDTVLQFRIGTADTTITTGNGTDGIFAWGAQLVEGTSARDYLRTETRLNIPRLDYSLGGCPNILLEPQRTNLALQSSSFDSATWTKTALTVTANTTISPSGIQDADTILGNGTSSSRGVSQIISVTSGTTYSTSFYVKKNTNNFVQILFSGAIFSTNVWANFDLNSGVLGSVGSAATASIESVGDGWYRCTIVATATATSSNSLFLNLVTSATSIRNESNTLSTSVYLWGFQSEAGAYATSYIPTTTASVTRNADVASKTGITSLIGQTEGTIFFDGVINGCQNAGVNILNSERNTNASFYLIYIKSSSQIRASLYSSGAEAAAVQGGSVPIGSRFKVAYAYKSGSSALYINGVQITTSSATFTLPNTIDDLYIADQTTYFSFGESVRNNATTLWKTRLTNAELAQLTTI